MESTGLSRVPCGKAAGFCAFGRVDIPERQAQHGPTEPLLTGTLEEREHGLVDPVVHAINRHLVDRYLAPFFGSMCVAEITRGDVRRWFDSMSATPGNANGTLLVLSVIVRRAEL